MASIDADTHAEASKKGLLDLLDDVPGKKNLVLQQSLVGRVELLFNFSVLKEHGINELYYLENGNVSASNRNIVFLVSGEKPKQAQSVASQIQKLQQTSSLDHDFSVICVPRRTLVFDQMLAKEGVLGDVTLSEWPLYLQPLEKDLLSMELDDSFGDLYLRRDPNALFLAAKALMSLQVQHGLFPRIFAKGDQAKRLAELLARMRNELTAEPPKNTRFNTNEPLPSSTIENLIILDRESDPVTPLLTQLTYEGLIDEVFTMISGQVEVSTSVIGTVGPQTGGSQNGSSVTTRRKVRLYPTTDSLYMSLRDNNFAVVGSLLNSIARRLASTQDQFRQSGRQFSAEELKDVLRKLPGYQAEQQSAKLHTDLASEIVKQTRESDVFKTVLSIQQNIVLGVSPESMHEQIEELIDRSVPLKTVLRLLCLESCVSQGLRQRDFDNFRRHIVQAYGYKHILALHALEKMGLLNARGSGFGINTTGLQYIPGTPANTAANSISIIPQRTNYSNLRRTLHLIIDEVNEQEPDDIAYTFSGYAPLSIRLVQCILQKSYMQSLANPSREQKGAGAVARPVESAATDATAGWKGFEDALKNIKGPTVDERQTTDDPTYKARTTLDGHGRGGEDSRATSIVFFLGGITSAEVAAMRLVAKQEKEKKRRSIMIITTSMISGDKLMQVALDLGEVKEPNQV